MALEKEPETHLLQGLHRRELEKSASLQCVGATSFRFILSQLKKEEVKDRASPVAPVKNQVTGNEEFANSGHRNARAQEADHVRSSKMTDVEERGKRDKRQRTQSPTTRHLAPSSDVSNRTDTSLSAKEGRLPLFPLQERLLSERQELRLLARASRKPDAMFSSRRNEPGNQFESSIF